MSSSYELPDYDKFIIDFICNTLRSWLDNKRSGVPLVWLHSIDIDHLEIEAIKLAKTFRDHELYIDSSIYENPPKQPQAGITPAKTVGLQPWGE